MDHRLHRQAASGGLAAMIGAVLLGVVAHVPSTTTASAAAAISSVGTGVPATPGAGALRAATPDLQAVPIPPWWNGMCDSGYNAGFQAVATWNGLIACGYGSSGSGGVFRLENEPG